MTGWRLTSSIADRIRSDSQALQSIGIAGRHHVGPASIPEGGGIPSVAKHNCGDLRRIAVVVIRKRPDLGLDQRCF
jgi:hypothetical protein